MTEGILHDVYDFLLGIDIKSDSFFVLLNNTKVPLIKIANLIYTKLMKNDPEMWAIYNQISSLSLQQLIGTSQAEKTTNDCLSLIYYDEIVNFLPQFPDTLHTQSLYDAIISPQETTVASIKYEIQKIPPIDYSLAKVYLFAKQFTGTIVDVENVAKFSIIFTYINWLYRTTNLNVFVNVKTYLRERFLLNITTNDIIITEINSNLNTIPEIHKPIINLIISSSKDKLEDLDQKLPYLLAKSLNIPYKVNEIGCEGDFCVNRKICKLSLKEKNTNIIFDTLPGIVNGDKSDDLFPNLCPVFLSWFFASMKYVMGKKIEYNNSTFYVTPVKMLSHNSTYTRQELMSLDDIKEKLQYIHNYNEWRQLIYNSTQYILDKFNFTYKLIVTNSGINIIDYAIGVEVAALNRLDMFKDISSLGVYLFVNSVPLKYKETLIGSNKYSPIQELLTTECFEPNYTKKNKDVLKKLHLVTVNDFEQYNTLTILKELITSKTDICADFITYKIDILSKVNAEEYDQALYLLSTYKCPYKY